MFGYFLLIGFVVISAIIVALPGNLFNKSSIPGSGPKPPRSLPEPKPPRAPTAEAARPFAPEARAQSTNKPQGRDFFANPGPLSIFFMLIAGLLGALGGRFLGFAIISIWLILLGAATHGHGTVSDEHAKALIFYLADGGTLIGMIVGVLVSSVVSRFWLMIRKKPTTPASATTIEIHIKAKNRPDES